MWTHKEGWMNSHRTTNWTVCVIIKAPKTKRVWRIRRRRLVLLLLLLGILGRERGAGQMIVVGQPETGLPFSVTQSMRYLLGRSAKKIPRKTSLSPFFSSSVSHRNICQMEWGKGLKVCLWTEKKRARGHTHIEIEYCTVHGVCSFVSWWYRAYVTLPSSSSSSCFPLNSSRSNLNNNNNNSILRKGENSTRIFEHPHGGTAK